MICSGKPLISLLASLFLIAIGVAVAVIEIKCIKNGAQLLRVYSRSVVNHLDRHSVMLSLVVLNRSNRDSALASSIASIALRTRLRSTSCN